MFERIIRTALLIGVIASAKSAHAITTLKQVQVKDGSQVELIFDGKVGKSQVRTEFFNDVIQVSLTDVSVYPAKISSVSGVDLVKIFAYQYAPKLVRCRLTVKGKAEDFKDRLEIIAGGRQMTLRVAGTGVAVASETTVSDQVTSQAAHAEAPPAPAKAQDLEKGALLDHVMGTIAAAPDKPRPALAAKPADTAPSERKAAKVKEASSDEPLELGRGSRSRDHDSLGLGGGGRSLPSPMGVLLKLAFVLGLFGAIALVMKRFSRANTSRVSASHQLNARLNARLGAGEASSGPGLGWMGSLGNIASSAAKGLGRKEKLIEVISNHHLGPKKSIAVVKVMGRILVLGVSNDAINLITQIEEGQNPEDLDLAALGDADPAAGPSLGSSQNSSHISSQFSGPTKKPAPAMSARGAAQLLGYGSGATAGGPTVFADLLKDEQARPAAQSTVRNQIKSRLEGLKQL